MKVISFGEFVKACYKTYLLISIIFITIIVTLVIKFSNGQNPSELQNIIVFLVLLFSFLHWWYYIDYKRKVLALIQSNAVKFFLEKGFEINERFTGWSHYVNFFANYKGFDISFDLVKQKGFFLNKYSLEISTGIEQIEETANKDQLWDKLYEDQILLSGNSFLTWRIPIKLLGNNDVKTDLLKNLEAFLLKINNYNFQGANRNKY